MSEPLQSGQYPGASGQHPDADQLSAFVEHALPAHERQQMLAHLAVCPDCRETVALSLPQLEVAPVPVPVRRPWFRSLVVYVPATAAALAATIFFAVSLHRTNTTTNGASARGNAARQLDQLAAAPQPAVALPPKTTASPVVAPDEKKSRSANLIAPAAPLDNREIAVNRLTAPKASLAPPPAATADESTKPLPSAAGGAMGSLAASPVPPLNAPAPQPSPSVFQSSAAQPTVNVSGNQAAPDTVSANLPLKLDAPARMTASGYALPSGQAPLSVVAKGAAILAIDAHNAVFFSRDAGMHWIQVATPWQGHAIKADLVVRDKKFAPAMARMKAFSNAAPPAPASVASLTGAITDPTGAAIPQATVTLRDDAPHSEVTVTADATGRYAANNLAPGNYTIDAQAAGFQIRHIDGVAVQSAKQNIEDIVLQLGTVTQTVAVAGESKPAPPARGVNGKSHGTAAAGPAQPVFAITTDSGEHWTSTDGVTWMRQ